MNDHDPAAVASLLFELGAMKRMKRTGWWIAGVTDPESIAEHSHRTSVVAAVLAMMEGADPARAALLATFHDMQETRVTDIPHIGRRYLAAASNSEVTADQVADCPPAVATGIQSIVDEFEAQETSEARVARDADKLECLLQAIEYHQQGTAHVQRWIDSSRQALKTESARCVADAAVAEPSTLRWLTTFRQAAE